MKQKDLPKLRRSTDKRKITIYIEKEIEALYRQGKQNGWDVSEIVRNAASEALQKEAEMLMTSADVA